MSQTNPCQEMIHQEILRHGSILFARFVELALYHPLYGYYMQERQMTRGRKGDFYTSAQVSPLFGEVLAEAFIAMRKTLGCQKFTLIEWGAGNGQLASDILCALEKKGVLKNFRYLFFELNRHCLSNAKRRLSRFEGVIGVSSLKEYEDNFYGDGCIFSNEFVDALPFHRLVRDMDGHWKEVAVSWKNQQFQEILVQPTIPLPKDLLSDLLESPSELLYRPQAIQWLTDCTELISRGYILTIDYGSGRPDYWDVERSGSQWGCFYGHVFDKDPYVYVGLKDITADVEFTSLAEAGIAHGLDPVYFNTQAQFLLKAGQAVWENHLSGEPSKAHLAAQHLMHPLGMGERFQVLLQSKQAPVPEFLTTASNRLKRLGSYSLVDS